MLRRGVCLRSEWVALANIIWIAVMWIQPSTIAAAGPVPFELTGVVLDFETRVPIEGAYVLAGYHETVAGPAAVKQWCVRTRGMTTGADGRFHFPVDRLDGQNPAGVDAIKPGYYLQFVEYPNERVWKKQDANVYANRTIFLSKQDERLPKFRYGSEDAFCSHARRSADALAGVEFLKIELAEMVRLGAPDRQLGAVRDMIERLQGIDSAPPNALNPKVSR